VSRRRRIRGYPIAVLVGLNEKRARVWNVYSQSIKPDAVIEKENSDYNFYEAVINQIRPKVKQGVKTLLVASTEEKKYDVLYEHIEKHQRWLIEGYELNRATIRYVEGSAMDIDSVMRLIEDSGLQRTIKQASQEDVERIMGVLDKRLGTAKDIDTLLFTLCEVEEAVYVDDPRIEYILVTTEFQRKHRGRIQRLLQIAQNKNIKTMTVETKTPMGARLTQFGGLITIVNQEYTEK
jgi:stalled ribosome rescue protein Dom34